MPAAGVGTRLQTNAKLTTCGILGIVKKVYRAQAIVMRFEDTFAETKQKDRRRPAFLSRFRS